MTLRADCEKAAAVAIKCTCHEDYTKRNRDDPSCFYHNYDDQLVDVIEAAARRFAERAVRSMAKVSPDISDLRRGCFVAIIQRSQFGIPTEAEAHAKIDEYVAAALAAAEKE